MKAADYYDWWFFSGIQPGIPTRPANYAVLCDKLSASGAHLIVMWQLLLDNKGLNETAYVIDPHIFGAFARVAEAARATGAVRLAEFVATLPDPTTTPEDHDELRMVLKAFAKEHAAELMADIERHGDPRKAPGFDKKQAKRDRDARWGENNWYYQISDQIPFLAEPMTELHSHLARGLTLAEIAGLKQEMKYLAFQFEHDFRRWATYSPQPPEVGAFLDECRRLCEDYPEQLPTWPEKS